MVKEDNEGGAGDRSLRDLWVTLRNLGLILRVSSIRMTWDLHFRKIICIAWWSRKDGTSEKILMKFKWLKRQNLVTYLICGWRSINPCFIHSGALQIFMQHIYTLPWMLNIQHEEDRALALMKLCFQVTFSFYFLCLPLEHEEVRYAKIYKGSSKQREPYKAEGSEHSGNRKSDWSSW